MLVTVQLISTHNRGTEKPGKRGNSIYVLPWPPLSLTDETHHPIKSPSVQVGTQVSASCDYSCDTQHPQSLGPALQVTQQAARGV